MLNTICIKISEVIRGVLAAQTEVKDGAICDPSSYYGSIYRLQCGLLGIVVGDKLPTNSLFNYILEDCNEFEKQAIEAFENWFRQQSFTDVDLSELYELMLLLDFPVGEDGILEDKENLNSIGTFYTPTELAEKIVEVTLNDYILRNTGIEHFSTSNNSPEEVRKVTELLTGSTFADHSCGTGNFFLAIIDYCRLHLNPSMDALRKIVLNFRAIEADSISLEIAKLQLLNAIESPELYDEIDGNFIHANPLIVPSEEAAPFHPFHEFYYANELAISPDQIPVCDVVLGNPPWGNVEFDIAFYLHVLCPKILELEDEAERDQALEDLAESHPSLYEWLLHHDEAIDLAMDDIYEDERFAHSTMGGLQTNLLFTELCNQLVTERGSVGLLLKGTTLSDPMNKPLWNHLTNKKRVMARYDLINCNRIFNIGPTETFSILILGNNPKKEFVHRTDLMFISEIG